MANNSEFDITFFDFCFNIANLIDSETKLEILEALYCLIYLYDLKLKPVR